MNHTFSIDPAMVAPFLADEAEQMAHHVHRLVAALQAMAADVKAFYVDVLAPFIEWLQSMQASEPAKV